MNEWAKSEKQLEVLWKRSVCVCWGGGALLKPQIINQNT